MRASISVVIPALNEADSIRETIAAVRADDGKSVDVPASNVEILVVDGGSTDGTPDLLPDDVTLVCSPPGRAVQLNRGAAASHGEVLVFCHADSRLPRGWRQAVLEALADEGVSGGTFQTLLLPERGLILRLRNHMRMAANWRVMFGDQVQFMRRRTFNQVGGFPEIPLMEDVEMSRALAGVGRLVRVPLPLRVVTSSRRFLDQHPLRQTLRNAWNMFRYLYLGATPEDIARTYRSDREKRIEARP